MPRVWLHRVRDQLEPPHCMQIHVLKVISKRESKQPADLIFAQPKQMWSMTWLRTGLFRFIRGYATPRKARTHLND